MFDNQNKPKGIKRIYLATLNSLRAFQWLYKHESAFRQEALLLVLAIPVSFLFDISFKEQIVLKPNVEYIFGQWERANDNLFLTIIPTSEFEKRPSQKSISKLPKLIKHGVHEFLNNIGYNLNF